jgi:2-amino-4-hydroxy-6-hydroxymethyldihydropteridine diphosphokinase
MIYMAIGANLPNYRGTEPLQTCRWAVARLATLPGLSLAGVSRWYDSAPIPPSDQPRYINGVAALAGTATPEWLLAAIQRIEAEAGRVRGVRDAARVLDLDIIDLDGLVRDAPDPILPHPCADRRGFVLYPLRDVAEAWVHPRLGTPIARLIAALPGQDIRMVDEGGGRDLPG